MLARYPARSARRADKVPRLRGAFEAAGRGFGREPLDYDLIEGFYVPTAAAASSTRGPLPRYGRDLKYTFGEIGLPGHSIKILLHNMFFDKGQAPVRASPSSGVADSPKDRRGGLRVVRIAIARCADLLRYPASSVMPFPPLLLYLRARHQRRVM